MESIHLLAGLDAVIAFASALLVAHLARRAAWGALGEVPPQRATRPQAVTALLKTAGAALPLEDEERSRAQMRLAQAGIGVDAAVWGGVRAVSLAAGALSALFALYFLEDAGMKAAAALVTIALGAIAPELYLRSARKKRVRQIEGSLPGDLELLSVTVEAGYTLERGIRLIGEKTQGPLAQEFALADSEMRRLNLPAEQALERMAARCDVQGVSAFCAATVQAKRQGSSVARVLRAQAHSARDEHTTRIEEQINQVPNKMVPVIFLLFFPGIIAIATVPFVVSAAKTLGSLWG